MATILWHDHNDHLSVTLYDDASATIHDQRSGARWQMGRVALQEDNPIDVGHVWLRTTRSICEEFPGRFRGEQQGDALRWTLLGREGRAVGQFTTHVRLDGPWLEITIDQIDDTLPSLIFPPPIVSESLVLPQGVGRWVRSPLPDRHFWTYPAHLNMRWFGGLRGDNGWLCVLHNGAENAGALATNLHIAPGWLRSLGRWTPTRTVRYRLTGDGYVGLARSYRQYAIEQGMHVPLTEKFERVPAARSLLGGRLLSIMQARGFASERYEDRMQTPPHDAPTDGVQMFCRHAQAAQVIRDARDLGMERGIVNVRGWISGGYDETHPDIWPPEPALGTIDELKQLLAQPDPLLAVLHDNYQDIYQQSASWPRGVNRSQQGEPMPGGLWAGGQAYILNSRDSLRYARRNWKQIRTLAPRGMFIDTTTAAKFYESYEAGNELTRAQDQALKIELLRFYRDQGLALGSEEGADWGVPYVDWIENRHRRVANQSIPLWPLVFHDAVFNLRYNAGPLAQSEDGQTANWLADMLWGYPLIWGVKEIERWQRDRAAFGDTLHVDRWHAQIGADDLIDHQYLSDDGEVEQTIFASGAAIVANFADEPRTADGVTIPARDYVIR